MPRFKVAIRKQDGQQNKEGKYNVKIRVTHKQKTRYIGTDLNVLLDQIDNRGNIIKHPNASHYNIQLRNILNVYDKAVLDLGGQAKSMEMRTLVSYLKDIDPLGRDDDFFFLADKVVLSLNEEKRQSYAKTIEYTMNILKDFSRSSILMYSEITPGFLEDFSRYLKFKNHSVNSIAIHLRNIRMVYNKAIDSGKASISNYPFRKFKIKQETTRKRSLQIEDIKRIRDVQLDKVPHQKARDLFMLSFYLIGINFKDLLYARHSDIHRERLEFNRAKTNRSYSIKIFPEARYLINRYLGDELLLSLMESKFTGAKTDRSTIIHKDIISQTNQYLKKIAKEIGITDRISTYYARHSWATIARNLGVPKDDIRSALGHGDLSVTDIYIDLDLDRIDRANLAVIESLSA